MLYVWIYVLFGLSVHIKERGLSFQTFPHFQLPKKKLAVTKVFASVELQGSTFLTGMGLKIRCYAALAPTGVWLPLSISFSISFMNVYAQAWKFGLRFFRMLTLYAYIQLSLLSLHMNILYTGVTQHDN